MLETLEGENILYYNGTISDEQLAWFEQELSEADAAAQRAIVMTHVPINPAATGPRHLVWDYQRVLDVLDRHDCVDAVLCGHYHSGAYDERRGVHHLTLRGALEAPEERRCCAVLDVFADRLELIGFGAVESRTMLLSRDDVEEK
jgi:hypothetical protein